MEKINLPTATKNLQKHFPLLLSNVAALCLFLSPSLTSLLMIAAIFVIVAVAALLDRAKPPVVSSRLDCLVAMLITLLIVFMGYDTFKTTWTPSSKVAALASAFHLTTPILLLIVGMVGCVVGFYAMYVLSCWIVTWGTQMLKERLHTQKKSEIVASLKRNWYFPISAMAFFCLNLAPTLGYLIGLLIAFSASLIVSSQVSSLLAYIKKAHVGIKIGSLLTAMGICLNCTPCQGHF